MQRDEFRKKSQEIINAATNGIRATGRVSKERKGGEALDVINIIISCSADGLIEALEKLLNDVKNGALGKELKGCRIYENSRRLEFMLDYRPVNIQYLEDHKDELGLFRVMADYNITKREIQVGLKVTIAVKEESMEESRKDLKKFDSLKL